MQRNHLKLTVQYFRIFSFVEAWLVETCYFTFSLVYVNKIVLTSLPLVIQKISGALLFSLAFAIKLIEDIYDTGTQILPLSTLLLSTLRWDHKTAVHLPPLSKCRSKTMDYPISINRGASESNIESCKCAIRSGRVWWTLGERFLRLRGHLLRHECKISWIIFLIENLDLMVKRVIKEINWMMHAVEHILIALFSKHRKRRH